MYDIYYGFCKAIKQRYTQSCIHSFYSIVQEAIGQLLAISIYRTIQLNKNTNLI